MNVPPEVLWEFIQNHLWVSVISIFLGIVGYHGRWQKIRKLTDDDDGFVSNIAIDFFVEAIIMTHLMAFVGLLVGQMADLSNNMRLLIVIVMTLKPREFLELIVDAVGMVVKGSIGIASKSSGKDGDSG